jgi:hypothetical protein
VLQEFDAMTAPSSIDPARFLAEQLERASPDLLRQMLKSFIDALMSAEADAVCGAEYAIARPIGSTPATVRPIAGQVRPDRRVPPCHPPGRPGCGRTDLLRLLTVEPMSTTVFSGGAVGFHELPERGTRWCTW